MKHHDEDVVGRRFAAAVNGIGLAIFPGNYNEIVSPKPTEFGVMWPTLIPASLVPQRVVFPAHEPIDVSSAAPATVAGGRVINPARPPDRPRDWSTEPTTVAPLGRLFGARSGDKGGNANIGVWARTDDAYDWLLQTLTPDCLHQLMPETKDLVIDRYTFANLRAVNFLIRGLLEEGVAATTRPDAQAKSLGEFLRSRRMELPDELLEQAQSRPPAAASPGRQAAARVHRQ